MMKCYIVFADYDKDEVAMTVFESKAAARRYVAKLNRYFAKKPVLPKDWDSKDHIRYIMEKTKWNMQAPVMHHNPTRGWSVQEFDFHPARKN